MDLDTTTLKECRLGPIVLFYTKTKRVTPAITRAAEGLVQSWSRPIIKRPSNYHSLNISTAQEVDDGGAGGGVGADNLENIAPRSMYSGNGQKKGGAQSRGFDVRAALRENAGRKGARMPVVQVSS